MWLRATQTIVDKHGREVSREVTVNMDSVVACCQLNENQTRLFAQVGHDLEDHRSASWVDIDATAKELNQALAARSLRGGSGPAVEGE